MRESAATFDGDFSLTRSGARVPREHGVLSNAFGVFVDMIIGVEEFLQGEDRPHRDACPKTYDNDGVDGAVKP